MTSKLNNFTDVLNDPDEICDSQPLSLSSVEDSEHRSNTVVEVAADSNIAGHFRSHSNNRPVKRTGQYGEFRSVDEIDVKYRNVFSYPFFNLVQSRVIEDALYSDKSMVVCAPTGSGKTVVFEMAIVHLLMELEDRNENHDFKIIYMAPVKALCTERLTEWYSKFTKLGLLCIEVTGDTDVDFSQLKPYRIIITTPEKWDMLTRRWRDHRQLVELIKLFLIDEVHILNDETRGPVLEAVVSRMKTIETSVQSTHRIEQLQQQYQGSVVSSTVSPSIRFVAVSATVSNPEDVAAWLGTTLKPAVYYKFGDECRPVKLRRIVEGYPCAEGTSIFKFDLILNYKLWPIIQKYHNGKPTLIFCNTRKSVAMTAETLSREITISFNEEQKARLMALASTIKNKKLQTLVLSGVGCHHAGLLYEERANIEQAFRNRNLPILITTTTLAMGVNLPAHLVIIKNTQQYVSGAYQEYSISTILQMVGRAGRPQFDTEATAVIMTRLCDKPRYQALVGGSEPLQSYLHKRLPENLNSEAALGTVSDVAQCVQWLRSTFLSVRAAKDPKRYLGLPQTAPQHQISKKIEELCVKAMNSLASAGLITMDEACCIEATEAGRLMSIYYLDLETMKHIMKIEGSESLERLLWIVCESHELSDMHLRMDERRCLNALNRNNATSTIRFPMKGKITTRQMKLNCVIQAILGCLPIPDPSLNQEATKIMRIADRICKCLVAYVTRPALASQNPKCYSAVLNTIILAKCVAANLWENSPFVSKQLKGIGPTFSTLLATAGKANFMLLEESHPRDLERIMNKGPPAGNLIRKQISLFPKYQLTMTPIDEKVVSVQLVLLNHHNLSENMEQLTAGAAHKSYVIIGDSENTLLLLTSFSDKDLIGVYDGSIIYQITRKHGFEHKIYAHCVSSTFAGIDVQCEYVFKNVEPQLYTPQTDNNADLRKPAKKQTTITDTFRERKRKNTDNEITQCKEKKKRESALFEKFKNLKESFGKTSKVLKDDLDKSAIKSEKILQELTHLKTPDVSSANALAEQNDEQLQVHSTFFEEPTYEINEDDFTNVEFIDEDKINDILTEIESEITKGCKTKSKVEDKTKFSEAIDKGSDIQKAVMPTPVNIKSILNRNFYTQNENYKAMNNNRKRGNKPALKKTNYNFIDLLENNVDLSDTEETTGHEQNSFSNAIRSHIEKYLQKTKNNVKPIDGILDLIQDEPLPSKEYGPTVIVQDSNITGKIDDTDTLDKTIQLTSGPNEEKLTTTDVNKEFTADDASKHVSKQFTVLENRIKSIDLNEMPSIDCDKREINEKNEFPSAELLLKINEDDIAFENRVEKIENKLIPEVPEFIPLKRAEHNTSSNINMESENQSVPRIIKSINAENICDNKLNKESNLKIPESVLCAGTLDSLVGPFKTDNPSDEPKAVSKEKQEFPEIEWPRRMEPNQINMKPIEDKNRELVAYNDRKHIAFGIQKAFQHHETKLPGLQSTNHSATNEKQEMCVMELWKSYIKKLPLDSDINNKEKTTYNNLIDFNQQKASTLQNDKIEELPAALQYDISKIQSPELKKIYIDTEMPKNNGKGIISTYKRESNGKPQYCNNVLPTDSQYATSSEEIEPPKSNLKENREIKTLCFASCGFSSQPTCIQQNILHELPYILPNTISLVPELHENEKLLMSEPKNSNPGNNDITPYKNQSGTIENHTVCTQQHYNNDKVPISFTTELHKQSRPLEMKSKMYNKELVTMNNPTTCALENRQAFTQNNDYLYTRTNNKNHYINKYSFSSNKTDVSTKETADHVVRVIRNLRIDLDITEIVSEGKKTMEQNTGKDIEEKVDENEEDSNVAFKRPKLAITPTTEQGNENSNAMVTRYSSDFGKKIEHNSDKLILEKSLENYILPLTLTDPKFLESDTHIEWMKEDNCYEDNKSEDQNTKDHQFNKYKIDDYALERKPNNVMSILQKYSNIMRNTKNVDLSLTQIKSNDKTSNATKKEKPKRPFKISDIHRINPASLPGVLVEKSKAVNAAECFNLLKTEDKYTQLEQNKQQNVCKFAMPTPVEPEIEQEYSEDSQAVQENYENLDISNYETSSYIDDLEVKDAVSNIDQNMFNPKAILQYFSKDESEDIVPPPPEFSDYLNTKSDTNTDVTLSKDCYEPMGWDEKMDVSESIHNRSIFQDSCQFELTPSKEIETWNLSREERNCKMYASPILSPYSFTIMRKNKEPTKSASDNSLLQNMTLPRHNKLKQFKFNHKSKFKL